MTDNPSAAVLILIYNDDQVLMIKRAANPRDRWASQIAFPGGRLKPNEDPLSAAKREFHEEVGLDADRYDYVRELELVNPMSNSNLKVKPYVFRTHEKPEAKCDPAEVQEARLVNVRELRHKVLVVDNRERDAYVYNDWTIWGMSKRILDKLFELRAVDSKEK